MSESDVLTCMYMYMMLGVGSEHVTYILLYPCGSVIDCLSCGDNNGGCRSNQECTIDNSTDYPTNYYSDSYNGSEHRRCPIQTFVCKEFPYGECLYETFCKPCTLYTETFCFQFIAPMR